MTKNTPNYFKFLKGNYLIKHNNQYWILNHLVCNRSPRIYYSIFIIVDESFNIIKTSKIFKITKHYIEYVLNFNIIDKWIIFSYSEWDKTSKLIKIDLQYFKKNFF